jgi:uridine kinase
LGNALDRLGAPVIRASVDGFHHPREIRYRLGRDSPEGFYRDSYDLDALQRELLDPLSPGGSRRYRTAIFDHVEDRPVQGLQEVADRTAVLILDGLFLHRRELRSYWDLSIFLDAPFAITVPRGAARGDGWGSPDPAAPSNRRYVEGQRIYFAQDDPITRATIVIDHSDLTAPQVRAWRI